MTAPGGQGERAWAEAWQASWDEALEADAPGREARLAAVLDVTEALAGPQPLVVELGCGPGSLTRRLLARSGDARAVAVDHDPVLLAIATATFAGDRRVRVVDADLSRPGWAAALGPEPPDAVLLSAVTHYLDEPGLRGLYAGCAGLLRPGGVLANVDRMPLEGLGGIGAALAARDRAVRTARWEAGAEDWGAWWERAVRDPALASAHEARRTREALARSAEWHPPAGWHRVALLDAGFREATVTHRWGDGALVVARR